MARAVPDIYEDIQSLSESEKKDLLQALVTELDAPTGPDVDKTWLAEVQRRYQELVDGTVKGYRGILFLSICRLELVDELRISSGRRI